MRGIDDPECSEIGERLIYRLDEPRIGRDDLRSDFLPHRRGTDWDRLGNLDAARDGDRTRYFVLHSFGGDADACSRSGSEMQHPTEGADAEVMFVWRWSASNPGRARVGPSVGEQPPILASDQIGDRLRAATGLDVEQVGEVGAHGERDLGFRRRATEVLYVDLIAESVDEPSLACHEQGRRCAGRLILQP